MTRAGVAQFPDPAVGVALLDLGKLLPDLRASRVLVDPDERQVQGLGVPFGSQIAPPALDVVLEVRSHSLFTQVRADASLEQLLIRTYDAAPLWIRSLSYDDTGVETMQLCREVRANGWERAALGMEASTGLC
jgi:hypothetical protein